MTAYRTLLWLVCGAAIRGGMDRVSRRINQRAVFPAVARQASCRLFTATLHLERYRVEPARAAR
jgi:hypothetical protein